MNFISRTIGSYCWILSKRVIESNLFFIFKKSLGNVENKEEQEYI